MEKPKLNIVIETEYVESPDTKQSIVEYLEQKCLKEKMAVEEAICFSLKNLKAKSKHRKHFKAGFFC